jgi:hypothetical protein
MLKGAAITRDETVEALVGLINASPEDS